MKAAVLVCGGLGAWLLLTSLPPFRGRSIKDRLEPYLHGLGGRPSRLLVRPSAVRWRWFARLVTRAGLLGHAGLRRRLEAAGRAPDEVAFRFEQAVWGFLVGGITFALGILASLVGAMPGLPPIAAVSCIGGITAALARDWFLSKEIEWRQSRLAEELPTAIDHMTLALLAGESVPSAFARIAREAPPVVATEFGRVDADIRGGATVVEALESLRARMPDAAVARFVDALCSAVERGTSLAEVLRAQADDVREARRRRLMELGGRREVLMLVPVVFLIMPVVVVFALYPGLVSLDLLVP